MDQSDGALAQVECRDGFRDVLEDLKYLISPPRGTPRTRKSSFIEKFAYILTHTVILVCHMSWKYAFYTY